MPAYVANKGNNTIVRMGQGGNVLGVRGVALDSPVKNASLNGIATSTDGKTIYVTFTMPSNIQGSVSSRCRRSDLLGRVR